MARSLPTWVADLIATGHREDHTAIELTLATGPSVYFATGLIEVNDPEVQLYQAELRESDPLKMDLAQAQDGCTVRIQNVDMVFGQLLTSAGDALDGATAILGLIIVDPATGDAYFDPKMPCDVIADAVDEKEVPLNLIGEIYAAQVVGETWASDFSFLNAPGSTAAPPIIVADPNDLRDPNDPFGIGPNRGRLPDDPSLGFLHV